MEALQIKSALGEEIWSGWGTMKIPVILWNAGYEFLVNYPGEPPAEWKIILDDGLPDKHYYRRPAQEPENFAVLIGDVWTASMGTKSAADEFLISVFRDLFPPPIDKVFPYRVLIQPSETQIGGLLHETFHVYQINISPDRLKTAEAAHRLGDRYQTAAQDFTTEWKEESALLADALEARTNVEKANRVKQFLAAREARRKEYQLIDDLLHYERWLEWEEGVAKYLELASLRAAHESPDYTSLSGLRNDSDFKNYQNFEQRWSQEIFQLRYQLSSGENWFYQSGMAQAFLLDDFMPDWKEKIFEENIFLEDLLAQAILSD